MNLASMTLTGLFVWSSFGTSPVLTPPAGVSEATKQVAPLTEAPERTFSVMITGYNAVPGQTDSDPFTTASGAYSNHEVIAAVSQDLRTKLPFGTVIAVEAVEPTGKYCGYDAVEHLIGYRVIGDLMNPRHTNMVDILLDQDDTVKIGIDRTIKEINPALALGSCGGITVRVVGKIAIKDIPETQSELAMRVEKTLAAK